MKRFFADLLLIAVFVMIGSYLVNQEPKASRFQIEDKVSLFEQEITRQEVLDKKVDAIGLNTIEENNAGKIAKGASEAIVTGIDSSVRIFFYVFDGLLS